MHSLMKMYAQICTIPLLCISLMMAQSQNISEKVQCKVMCVYIYSLKSVFHWILLKNEKDFTV